MAVTGSERLERCAACVVAAASAVLLAWLFAPRWDEPLGPLDRERWAQAWVGAWNSRSVEQIEPLFGEGGRYTTPMALQPLPPVQAARHVASFWQRFPSGRVELRAVQGSGHEVVVEWVAYPVNKAGGAEIAGVTVLTIHQGKVQWAETQYNAAALLPYFFQKR